MNIIQTPSQAYEAMEVTLNGKVFTLTFRWSDRYSVWKFDVEDSDGNFLEKGISCRFTGVLSSDNIELRESLDGVFLLYTTRSTEERCGRDNFGLGKTYQLAYVSDTEISLL